MGGRESPPPEKIRIVGKFSAVQPNGADSIAPLEVLVDSIRQLDELDGIGINQRTCHALGIAVLIGISSVCGGNGATPTDGLFRVRGSVGASKQAAIGRLVGIEHFLTERRKRRNFVSEAAVSAIGAGAAAAI